ncbi:MAG: hypothetical protein WCK26_00470 [Candidatus Saccharibacteria bacterium]
MKKADIAMIVLIASASVLISFFVARGIFGDVYNGSEKVKTIDEINSTVEQPSKNIFNKNAINPAINVQIISTDSSKNNPTTPGTQ